MHAVFAFYSRELCTVATRDFSGVRFLAPPVTMLLDSIVAGLRCITFHAAFVNATIFALLLVGTMFQ